MVAFPTFDFPAESVYVRWGHQEPSEGFNRKTLASPKGVYQGFTPGPLGTDPANKLLLSVGAIEGYSLVRVRTANNYIVDIFLQEQVILDFTGHTFANPVYLIAKASYTTTGETRGQIFTRETPGDGDTEINICRVEKPANLSVFTTVPSDRHTNVAHAQQDLGFMTGGSVENLADTLLTTAEVEAARQSVDGPLLTTLSDRLTTDYTTVAKRLARSSNITEGNTHIVPSGVIPPALNVSASFGNLSRTHAPNITIELLGSTGTGGSTGDGLISALPDNIVIPVIEETGGRMSDDDGDPIFARVTLASQFNLTGINSTFTNASALVTGDGDYVAAGLVIGDIVKGPDGNYYEVQGPFGPGSFFVNPAYAGASTVELSSEARRFEITFYVNKLGVEQVHAFNLAQDLNIKIFFTALLSDDVEKRDALMQLLRSHGVIIRDAAVGTDGVMLLSDDGGTTGLTAVQSDDSRLLNICKTDGSTPFTAVQSYDSTGAAPIALAENLVHKEYVDDTMIISEFELSASQISAATAGPSVQGFSVLFPFTVVDYYVTIDRFVSGPSFFGGQFVEITSLAEASSLVSVDLQNVVGFAPPSFTDFRIKFIVYGR